MQFPYDDTQYLEALAQDYLELMGEEPIGSTNNNLLVEYDTRSMQQDSNTQDTTYEWRALPRVFSSLLIDLRGS